MNIQGNAAIVQTVTGVTNAVNTKPLTKERNG